MKRKTYFDTKGFKDSEIDEVPEIVELVEEEVSVGRSGYFANRRLMYEKVTPRIVVAVGEEVPMVIVDNPIELKNLLAKGVIRKE